MAGDTFPKSERLLRRSDYEKLSHSRNKAHSSFFLLIWEPSNSGTVRLGITVSRRVGNAVVRNRLKRLVREFYRHHKSNFLPGEYNLILKRGAQGLSYSDLCRELDGILRRVRSSDFSKDTRKSD